MQELDIGIIIVLLKKFKMLRANTILAILLALNGLSHGIPSTIQDLAVRSRVDYSDIQIHDLHILDAFDAAGNGPLHEWRDDNNETYQSLYMVDDAEWDAMHHRCLETAYTQRLEEALGDFPKEHHDRLRKEKHESFLEALSLLSKSLVARVNEDDPVSWICTENAPLVSLVPDVRRSNSKIPHPGIPATNYFRCGCCM